MSVESSFLTTRQYRPNFCPARCRTMTMRKIKAKTLRLCDVCAKAFDKEEK